MPVRQPSSATQQVRRTWQSVRNAEKRFGAALRGVSRMIGHVVSGTYDPEDPASAAKVREALHQYSRLLLPWARVQAKKMIADVSRRDEAVWRGVGREMGRALELELRSSPVGELLRSRLDEVAGYITSLPIDAAHRVHQMTLTAASSGERPERLAEQIMKSGSVSRSRAELIARTEVARTASLLVQTRSEHVGSEGYIWRTVEDRRVREDHRHLAGRYFRWDDPPIADKRSGTRAHAGQIWNCFPGDTLAGPVQSSLEVFRSRYSGPLVVIRAGNTTLEATPNHPILTARGWIKADQLQQGDQLLAVSPQSSDRLHHDIHDRFLPLREIFELSASHAVSRFSQGVTNFHGDIPDGEVEVVSTEQYLSSHDNAGRRVPLQNLSDLDVAFTDMRVRSVGARAAQVAESGCSSSRDVGAILLGAAMPHHDLIGAGQGSCSDPRCFENFSNSRWSAAVFPGDRRCAETGAIISDHDSSVQIRSAARAKRKLAVDSVRHRDFSGFVYTLQALTGQYRVTPAGIIVKNCRCYPEPVIPDEDDSDVAELRVPRRAA